MKNKRSKGHDYVYSTLAKAIGDQQVLKGADGYIRMLA